MLFRSSLRPRRGGKPWCFPTSARILIKAGLETAEHVKALGATAALGVCFVLCVLAGDALFGFEGLALSFPVALSSAAAIGTLLFVLSGGTRIPSSSSTQSSKS